MIIVTGASGFVGRAVCEEFELRGLRVARIGRGAGADLRWPPPGADFDGDALRAMAGARAVVHLAGATIGERWTPARKRAIRESRVTLTAALARALAHAEPRPAAFVAASAVGIYGDRGDDWLDESSPPGGDFLATVAREWEEAAGPALAAGIRVAHLRLGVVLGRGGGMVARLRVPFRLGGGARLGSGRQWLSWISLEDTVRAIVRAVDDPAFAGAFNVVAPAPVTNAEFTQRFARALGRPALLAAPPFALRAAFGEMADGVLLASQRVRPARLLAAGFDFVHPSLDAALAAALGTTSTRPA
ncbi:MAG TPA: TIGR01777 family oxidoreductase [Gemmatimonadaceae bacterium]|nr:TIGR01777 family oxidoreductase [Gemmatimonadaceae bacterium]